MQCRPDELKKVSGGMFVQSACVVEQHHENPAEKLTFYGFEKNATTIHPGGTCSGLRP